MKRFVRTIAVALCIAAGAQQAAASGFVNTGDTWERLSPEDQAFYIEGVNDTANLIFVNDDLPTAIVKVARTRCLIEHKTTAANLATEITNVYVNNKAMSKQPPFAIYIYVMNATCKDIINQERGRMGLPPV